MRVACWKGEREGGRELERVSLPGTAVRDARKPATVSIAICQIGPLFGQPPMPVSFTSTFQGCATRKVAATDRRDTEETLCLLRRMGRGQWLKRRDRTGCACGVLSRVLGEIGQAMP